MRKLLTGLFVIIVITGCALMQPTSVSESMATMSPPTLAPTRTEPLSITAMYVPPSETNRPIPSDTPEPATPTPTVSVPTIQLDETSVTYPSLTDTLTVTPEYVLITEFSAVPAVIDPGAEVRLTWETNATDVTLCTTMRTGQLSDCWEVEPKGEHALTTLDTARSFAQYVLFAQQDTIEEVGYASVEITCPDEWFFSDGPNACPYPATLSAGAYQTFENGIMIWVAELDAIFVLYTDEAFSPRWERYQDTWEPGMPDAPADETPPPGLLLPVRGFGLTWRGPDTGVVKVRDRLGWATAGEVPIETGYQCDSPPRYPTCYLLGPDGVLQLDPERSGWGPYPSVQ